MAALIEAESVIAGRYRLLSLIGEGGMASVWRAEDQTLKRLVAIKLLYVRGQRDPRAVVDQFLREARIAASVQHRNVIHTVDFGIADEHLPYMVMELLNGESLAQRMEREPKLAMEEVVHIASLTLRGLGAVHEAGIVHRDLKPQNIFLHRDSDTVYPKILDFGISRSLVDDPSRPSAISTQDGMIVGTPDYMSPEQARGEANVDKRADIYSMGAIIFEGVTGRLPFSASTIGELIVQIVTTPAPTMRQVRPDVPQLLSDCVAQAMAHDREQRFVDATVFRRALMSAAETAFSADGRGVLTSEAPPRFAPVARLASPPSPAGPAPLALPSLPSPSAVPALPAPGAWGDFEGLGGARPAEARAPGKSASASPASPPSAARVVVPASPAGVAAPALAAPLPPPANGASKSPRGGNADLGVGAAALGSSALGSPFDPLDAAAAAGPALDLDYARRAPGTDPLPARSPVQRAAVQAGRALGAGATRGQAPTRAKVQAAVRAAPRAEKRAGLAPWILPILLFVFLVAFLLAPGIASLPPPDAAAAAELEAKNPATAGSDRLMQRARRSDLRSRPPAMRDVVF